MLDIHQFQMNKYLFLIYLVHVHAFLISLVETQKAREFKYPVDYIEFLYLHLPMIQ